MSGNDAIDKRSPTAIGSALAVLRSFTHEQQILGVTEIASRVGLHKSSVSRLLATLELEDLVEQEPASKRYRLGMGIVSLAAPVLADLDVRRASLPVLRDVAAKLDETAALVVWNGSGAVIVDQVPAAQPIKHTASLGTAYVGMNDASVRAFLAAMPPERREAAASAVAAAAPEAGSLDAFDLAQEERAGVSVNDGCSAPEEVGVAAAVRDHRGEVVGAVLISAPRFRVDAARLAEVARQCRAAADEIGTLLGHRTDGPRTGERRGAGRRRGGA